MPLQFGGTACRCGKTHAELAVVHAVLHLQVARSHSLPHAGSAPGSGKQAAAVKAEPQQQQEAQAGSNTAPGKVPRKVSTSDSLQADVTAAGAGKRAREKDSKAPSGKVRTCGCKTAADLAAITPATIPATYHHSMRLLWEGHRHH